MPKQGYITASQFFRVNNFKEKEIRCQSPLKQDIINWITAQPNSPELTGKETVAILKTIMNDMPPSGYISEFQDTAKTYAKEIALDILGFERREQYTNASCQWGIDNEFAAIVAYEDLTMYDVQHKNDNQIFLTHPKFNFVGCHPDGLINDDIILEVKCPANPTEHLNNVLYAQGVKDYYDQIQGHLSISGRMYCDFISFDPRAPIDMQLAIWRVPRDEDYITRLEGLFVKFWSLVQEYVELFKNRYEKGTEIRIYNRVS